MTIDDAVMSVINKHGGSTMREIAELLNKTHREVMSSLIKLKNSGLIELKKDKEKGVKKAGTWYPEQQGKVSVSQPNVVTATIDTEVPNLEDYKLQAMFKKLSNNEYTTRKEVYDLISQIHSEIADIKRVQTACMQLLELNKVYWERALGISNRNISDGTGFDGYSHKTNPK